MPQRPLTSRLLLLALLAAAMLAQSVSASESNSAANAYIAPRLATPSVVVYADYDAGGALVRKYVHGPLLDQKVAVEDYTFGSPDPLKYMWPEPNGTIHQVTNPSGGVLETRVTSAWGEPLDFGFASAPQTEFGYTGRRNLGNTGLMDYRARFYDPKLGRFLNPDPSGTMAGLNRYGYVRGDPVNQTDPSGLDPVVGTITLGPLVGSSFSNLPRTIPHEAPLEYLLQLERDPEREWREMVWEREAALRLRMAFAAQTKAPPEIVQAVLGAVGRADGALRGPGLGALPGHVGQFHRSQAKQHLSDATAGAYAVSAVNSG